MSNEDVPVNPEPNDESGVDIPPVQPEVGEPGIDPGSFPDDKNDFLDKEKYKDSEDIPDKTKEIDRILKQDMPENLKPEVYKIKDKPGDSDDGAGLPPPIPGANAQPLPPEKDPNTPPPTIEMPRQPFINLEEDQQK